MRSPIGRHFPSGLGRAGACVTALLLVLGLGATACVPAAVRVAAVAVGEIGADAFIDHMLGSDDSDVEAAGQGGTRSGGAAGLYGGSLRASRCDKAKLARFLTDPGNLGKATAWAKVPGIRVKEIKRYL